jgi:thiol:disulfide interchange protein DsbD
MKLLRHGLMLLAGTLCLAGSVGAKPWWMRGSDANPTDFLPPDEAFEVSARVDGGQIRVRWVIADGYYLYRQRMEVRAESPDLVVSDAAFPHGTTKTDPYLGTQEIFTQQIEGTAAYTRSDAGAHPVEIKVTYQGCAEAGLCYPPITKVIFPSVGAPAASAAPAAASAAPPGAHPHPWEGYAIWGGGLAFFLAGLALRKGRHLALPA